ncbi:unnamed protein product [Linum tenue]|uniref:Uncharacterized protein n=1 Tax=Linum tenue TaxID=586396 RepID=A0AAV0JG38_9ROSI|nr:unnamed protein product [Linum tenue]
MVPTRESTHFIEPTAYNHQDDQRLCMAMTLRKKSSNIMKGNTRVTSFHVKPATNPSKLRTCSKSMVSRSIINDAGSLSSFSKQSKIQEHREVWKSNHQRPPKSSSSYTVNSTVSQYVSLTHPNRTSFSDDTLQPIYGSQIGCMFLLSGKIDSGGIQSTVASFSVQPFPLSTNLGGAPVFPRVGVGGWFLAVGVGPGGRAGYKVGPMMAGRLGRLGVLHFFTHHLEAASSHHPLHKSSSNTGSVLEGTGGAIADGLSRGAGTAMAYRAVDAIVGPPQKSASNPATLSADTNACGGYSKALQDDIVGKLRILKLIVSVFVFSSMPELLFGLGLLYYFRVFKWQIGSIKYSVFILFSTVGSLLFEALALTLLKDPTLNLLTSGPYGLNFASFLPFLFDTLVATWFRVFDIRFSDKSFVYLAGLQLLLASWKRSLVPGICGILAGSLYCLNLFGVPKAKFPEFLATFASRFSWPSTGSPRRATTCRANGTAPTVPSYAARHLERTYPTTPAPSYAEPSESVIARH